MERERTPPGRARCSARGTWSTPRARPSGGWPRRIAATLRGKHKATFTPHIDTGDFVIVVNARQGQGDRQQGHREVLLPPFELPGGLKSTSLRDMRQRHPERILEAAVRGMLRRTTWVASSSRS